VKSKNSEAGAKNSASQVSHQTKTQESVNALQSRYTWSLCSLILVLAVSWQGCHREMPPYSRIHHTQLKIVIWSYSKAAEGSAKTPGMDFLKTNTAGNAVFVFEGGEILQFTNNKMYFNGSEIEITRGDATINGGKLRMGHVIRTFD
jgi:hypothetical protein